MRGSLVRGRTHKVMGSAHAGEDQQAVEPGAGSAFDVGVKPVSDHEDSIGGNPRRRGLEQRRLGLADDGVGPAAAQRGGQRRYEAAVTG